MESNQLAVLQRVHVVHAIHLFNAEQPVGQVYMNFYSVAVVTKHDFGTKQARVEWKRVFFR